MTIPKDPNILVSMVNMKLRDGVYETLSDMCASLGIDEGDLTARLKEAGFEYNPATRQFR